MGTVVALIAAAAWSGAAGADTHAWAPVDTAARLITLDEAIALARQNAPSIIAAQGQRRTGAAGVRSAYAAFLPTFGLSASANRRVPAEGARTIVENGQIVILPVDPWSYNIGYSASLDLFDGGQRFFDLQQAKARRTTAEASEVTEHFATTLAVKQQYFNVLAAHEAEAAAKAQLDQAEQQLKSSLLRVAAKTATRSDSLRSEIQVRTARLAVLDARNAVNGANASLSRIVGTPYPVTAAPEDSLQYAAVALDDASLRALALDGPTVKLAQAALDAARAARRSAWTSYLPSITSSYSRGGSGTGSELIPSGDDFTYSGSLRLSVSLPVFTQLQREEQVTQAEVAETNAEAALRDAQLAAIEGLARSLGDYRSAEEREASQVATVDAAEEDLRVQQQRYAVSGSTLLDVLSSQTQLDQSRRDLIRARYDLRVAKAELEALVGRDL
jgi:outer membrane protein